jgi:hypothetical protein
MAVDQAERRAGGDDQPAGGDGDAGTDVVGLAVGAAGFNFVSFAHRGRRRPGARLARGRLEQHCAVSAEPARRAVLG